MRMRVKYFLNFVVFICFAFSFVDANLLVTPSQTAFGDWKGWGVSLAWFGNVFGDRDDIADLLFSNNYVEVSGLESNVQLPGLNWNIARYNVGGCSYNEVDGKSIDLSPNIPEWKQIHGFWVDNSSNDPNSSSWDWTVDQIQLTALKKAVDRGANIVELFSNSPMWWMLNNLNPSGSANGAVDNLRSDMIVLHATYMATAVQYFVNTLGINVTSVDPFNEPIANWWTATGTQEGCHFDDATQASVIHCLREQLNNIGMKHILIAASDESTTDMAISTWNSFSNVTKQLVDIINVHGYEYEGGRRDVLYSLSLESSTLLRNSEYGDGDGSGRDLAKNWLLDFTWLHPESINYWQALDGGGWGLLDSDMDNAIVKGVNTKFFVVAQFSRHILQGMTILESGDPLGLTAVACDARNAKLVIVTFNDNTYNVTTTFSLAAYATAEGPITRWKTDCVEESSSTHARYQQIVDDDVEVDDNKSFSVTIAARQIQTLEVHNVLCGL